tara:strand:+ start:659 stop:883 length:225 start_codon:yes stop_codon:yes gene_type:complete
MAYIKIEIPTENKKFNELDCEELDYFIRDKQSNRIADDLTTKIKNIFGSKSKEVESRVFDIIQLYKFLDNKEGI